jgi:hypothetical protein
MSAFGGKAENAPMSAYDAVDGSSSTILSIALDLHDCQE